jgi:hypothetical protein
VGLKIQQLNSKLAKFQIPKIVKVYGLSFFSYEFPNFYSQGSAKIICEFVAEKK